MSALLDMLEGRRNGLVTERDALLNVAPAEFTAERQADFQVKDDEVRSLDERIAEIREQDAREARAAASRVDTATVTVTDEPNPVYRKGASASFFRDLFSATMNRSDASEARDRLVHSQETRALTTGSTAGGTFAPPLWVVDEFIKMARPGRVTADLVQSQSLPSGVSSINLPKVATGAATGTQGTQNTAVTNTDLTTSSVSSGITTIAGQQVISLQLLEQSGIPFDQVILDDLVRSYAAQVDNLVVSGLVSNGTVLTFTSTTPAVVSSTAANSFYNKLIAAAAAIATGRYLPADAIVMHPIRWGWVLEALDSQSRPLVVPNGPAFNQVATGGEPVAEGVAGTMAGLPVYLDPNIPQNLGVGTNQDEVFVLRRGDHWLYETAVQSASFDATYANQNSILFRVLGYAAFLTRYAASAQVIGGTGLVTPTL
ncbi:MAG: phage major capsid protein [Propionibacterium sp.]|nr:phage major capsid protein [Propionibacterium sp.]